MNTKEIIKALEIPSDYNRPTVKPCDGNAFAVFATVTSAVRKVDPALAKRYSSLTMQSDSYETVLAVASTLVDFDFNN